MSGGAGGGSPAPASPTARSGLSRSDSGSRMSFQCWRATAVAIGAVVGAWRPRRRCPWRRLGRCSGPSAPDTPERGECAVMGAVPGVPGHRPHAQEQSLFQSAPYFGHGGRVTTRMRCLPRAAGSSVSQSARAPPTPGRPTPKSNAQAWESDERRRNRHAAAPSTHPCGGIATAATAAPRPPEPEANRMVLCQKHLAPRSRCCLVQAGAVLCICSEPHKDGVGTLWPDLNRLSRLVPCVTPCGKGDFTFTVKPGTF